MTTETQISVSRGLSRLKTIEAQITAETQRFEPLAITVGGKLKNGENKEDVTKDLKAAKQSLTDLITHRNRLKSAIIRSNSETKVMIAGLTLTVAEVIDRKNSIALEKALCDHLLSKLAKYGRDIQTLEAGVTRRHDDLIQAALGKESAKSSAGSDEFKSISDSFMERNKVELFDPLNVSEMIKKFQDSVRNFEGEVDVILSEANARTMITI